MLRGVPLWGWRGDCRRRRLRTGGPPSAVGAAADDLEEVVDPRAGPTAMRSPQETPIHAEIGDFNKEPKQKVAFKIHAMTDVCAGKK